MDRGYFVHRWHGLEARAPGVVLVGDTGACNTGLPGLHANGVRVNLSSITPSNEDVSVDAKAIRAASDNDAATGTTTTA